MPTKEAKLTDYNAETVRDRLVDTFRKRRGEATSADLVALTGLPKSQVDAELAAVSDEYGARLKVTESGEILYSFPKGLKSRYRGFGPALKRFWKVFKKGALAAAVFLFKIWIVVMLVGYFLLFLALAILSLLASVAVQASGRGDSRDSRRGGGLGGLWLTGRLLDAFIRIWFYSELFKDPYQRAYERDLRASKRKDRRPLHTAVFSFVFGEGDPNAGWDEVERKAVLAFLQANKGVITMPEFMALTGLTPLAAETRINRYLKDFEGSPEVSPEGVLYYSFPSLLRRADKTDRSFGGTAPLKRLARFSANPKKANGWFLAINGVNLLFGSYFLWAALSIGNRIGQTIDNFYEFVYVLAYHYLGIASPGSLLGIALGAVPLAFSIFFFLIPGVRSIRLRRENEGRKVENLRRIAYRAALDSPEGIRPESLPVNLDEARPADSRAAEKILSELAAAAGGEPTETGAYAYPEIARARSEALKIRDSIKESDYDLGSTVFDSNA